MGVKKVLVIETVPINRKNRFVGQYVNLHMIRNLCEVLVRKGYVCKRVPVSQVSFNRLNQLFDEYDFFVFAGGEDVNPSLYGEVPYVVGSKFLTLVDVKQIFLARKILGSSKKALGICRGLQIFNVAAGGSLYQDLPDGSHVNKNVSSVPNMIVSHPVSCVEGSFVHRVLGDRVNVLSAHHQSVKRLGKNFFVTAFGDDNVVEGIENKKGNVVCAQFHVEDSQVYRNQLFSVLSFFDK